MWCDYPIMVKQLECQPKQGHGAPKSPSSSPPSQAMRGSQKQLITRLVAHMSSHTTLPCGTLLCAAILPRLQCLSANMGHPESPQCHFCCCPGWCFTQLCGTDSPANSQGWWFIGQRNA